MSKKTLYNRKNTRTDVLTTLVKYDSLTRTELTHLTGLSRATISYACSNLLEMNLIKETKVQPSTGGRPAISLQFANGTHAILGIEFQRLEKPMWIFGIYDLAFHPIRIEQFVADTHTPTATIENLVSLIHDFTADLAIELLPIMGLGLPGLIHSKDGMVISAPELNWNHLDISTILFERLGWKVSVMNNFKAHGLYEYRYGDGKKFNDLIYIGINQGIGGSLFQNKRLVHGGIGGAGEIGHMTMIPDGPLCSCGNTGCLETIAAAPAIERNYHSINNGNQHLTAKDICIAADAGDMACLKAVQGAATYMGIAMSNLVNVFNTECFILGGFIAQNSRKYVEIAEKTMRGRALSPLSKEVKVYVASRPQYGGSLGAAHDVLEENISFSLF